MSPLSEAQTALVTRARALVQALEDFLNARNETAPPFLMPHSGQSDEERDRVFAASTNNSIRETQEMQTAYASQFAGRALAIVEAFGENHITPPPTTSAHRFEHPTNQHGIQEVMRALGYMADKLELRG